MTATTMTKRTRFPMLLVVLAAIFGLAYVSVPPLNQHAVERHGEMATFCRDAIVACDPDDDDSDYFEGVTPDGTIYRILKTVKENGKTVWVLFITVAIGVTAAGKLRERTVTTYTVRSEGRVQALKERCRR